ncbi:hypothetical protein EDC56_3716 [Sinobacterium caligoides]|uniref:Heme oxygenase-like protein n=1 Tax=Sinobacterium caligoides TaxID=933926 RepID=A0A3N2D576_9GAMM|nr:hypothetical protein [Sinobacterium caligoides]ROR94903.1 hypothetical protein EDC56_3716 [Sinobacterium caligoides]
MQLPSLTSDLSLDALLAQSPLQARLEDAGEIPQWLGRALADVWYGFHQQLCNTPIVQAIESTQITVEEYQAYLLNMREQVSQGGRWISQAAASMENSHVLLRSALIRHAAEEHQDFLMLEKDFLRTGGDEQRLNNGLLNIGSQALSAFIFHEASKPNPVGIFGATFIIEGLGSHKAAGWSSAIQASLDIGKEATSFLYYHGVADEDHYENLIKILTSPFMTAEAAIETRRIAKVVGRLYALQLAEINNY